MNKFIIDGVIYHLFSGKQPYEEYYTAFDFTNYLDAETILSAVVSVIDLASPAVDVTATITTAGSQAITDGTVYVWVKGGSSGHTYKITCKVVCSAGSKHELDVILPVVEK